MRSYILLSISLLLLLTPHISGQGYRIGIKMNGLSGDTLILGEYFTTRMVPKDTLVLDTRGAGEFTGTDALDGGLYLIYLNQDQYFDFLLGDDQELEISADMGDLHGSMAFLHSEDNRVFQEYKAFLQEKRGEMNALQEELKSAASEKDSSRIQDRQKELNLVMEQYMDDIEQEYSNLFVTQFIGATREALPPEDLLNGEQRHDDSVRFFYYKEHYFDRFDPFSIRMLHTPLYEGKIKNYLSRAVPQHPDSLIVAVDYLLEGAKVNEDIYRYMLITLFNHFAESKFMGMDAVYFHIAEHYYIPDADWSSPDFISKLQENLDKNKPTLIGQQAPDLILRQIPSEHFLMAAQDTAIKKDPHIGQDFRLYDIKAEYTILYFWEGDCGHCKKATPALYEAYGRLKDKGVEVLSVHVINTIEGKELWVDIVNENGLYDWINCWSPYSNDFRRLYNLQSYPQLFVFDRDKKIVAKRVTPEQAEQIISNLISIESKNKQ